MENYQRMKQILECEHLCSPVWVGQGFLTLSINFLGRETQNYPAILSQVRDNL